MWRASALAAAFATLLAAALGTSEFINAEPIAAGMVEERGSVGSAAGTPVALSAVPNDPLDSDPLDGDPTRDDPLDGDPQARGRMAPPDQSLLEIVRSGRPDEEPLSLPAYDQDPQTVWTPASESEETWLWLDLGEERQLREVRWLALGSGTVGVAVSRDRRRWRNVDEVPVRGAWQGIELQDDARYVRIELLPDVDGSLPSIAEVAVYGQDDRASASEEQDAAANDRGRKRNQAALGAVGALAEENPRAQDTTDSGRENRSGGSRSNGRVRISAEPGETRCTGQRERCEARQGRVFVEEDCDRDGSCTIDVRADGGTAICDASGPDKAKSGNGERKRGGDGGACEAVANGGAVSIGDIDP